VCEFLGYFVETTREILGSVTARPPAESELFDSLLDFLGNLCESARDIALSLLEPVIPQFLDLANHPELRFRSMAMRFLGLLVKSSGSKIDPQLTEATITLAMRMAENDLDYSPFQALISIIPYAKSAVEPFAEQFYHLFIEKLRPTFIRSERTLRYRDNCVSCLVVLMLEFFQDPAACNPEESFPVILSALPLAVDFQSVHQVCRFFELCDGMLRENFPLPFFHVLVDWFASSDLVLEKMCMDSEDRSLLLSRLRLLWGEVPDVEGEATRYLRGDVVRMEYLRHNLELAIAEGEEAEAEAAAAAAAAEFAAEAQYGFEG
jgi:hypothetical protein